MEQSTLNQGVSLLNLLDEEAIEKIAHSTWIKIWTIFSNFGTVSAGFIGVIIIIRGIKLIIDTIIHGYAIYTVFGWSLHLIGAIWDSVTNLLLHLGRGKQNFEDQQKEQTKTNPSAPNFAINF